MRKNERGEKERMKEIIEKRFSPKKNYLFVEISKRQMLYFYWLNKLIYMLKYLNAKYNYKIKSTIYLFLERTM